jgi:hypothetical protein
MPARTGPTSQAVPPSGSRDRCSELLLFLAAFVAFAYFHQGGGWSQNGRFAMVRAIVEDGTFSLDSFLVYDAPTDPAKALLRRPVRDGRYSVGGETCCLAWMKAGASPVPLCSTVEGTVASLDAAAGTLDLRVAGDVRLRLATARDVRVLGPGGLAEVGGGRGVSVTLEPGTDGRRVARELRLLDEPPLRPTVLKDAAGAGVTGDLSFFAGRLHPNKAPGTSFLAVPGYFVVHRAEKALGIDPDLPHVLTLNAWLATVLSVGLVSALGVVVFRRAARRLGADPRGSLAAAVVFAFGTMFFPYATMLHEHDVVAVALLASYWLLLVARHRDGAEASPPWWAPAGSGFCAGWAAITSYLAAVAVVLLGLYALRGRGGRSRLTGFAAGVAVPFVLICLYNVACFGTPFATNYAHQNPSFESASLLAGVFALPSWEVLVALLVSPFRGLFFGTPVLVLGVAGLVGMLRSQERREDGALMAAIVAYFLLTVSSFNGWHGGSGVAPRYLLPALPFLALPVACVLPRWPRLGAGLAAVSVAAMLLTTAVDPQAGYAVGGLGSVPGRPDVDREPLKASFAYRPLTEYELAFLVEGRPVSLLRDYVEGYLEARARFLEARGASAPAVRASTDAERARIAVELDSGRPVLTPHVAFEGPVSVNPMGFHEGGPFARTAPRSPESRAHSLNAGELLWPSRRASLLPILAALALLLGFACRQAPRIEREAPAAWERRRAKNGPAKARRR